MNDKDTLDDAVALWGIGRSTALMMGADYAHRFAVNGLNTPFVRVHFLRGVNDQSRPTQEDFHVKAA